MSAAYIVMQHIEEEEKRSRLATIKHLKRKLQESEKVLVEIIGFKNNLEYSIEVYSKEIQNLKEKIKELEDNL